MLKRNVMVQKHSTEWSKLRTLKSYALDVTYQFIVCKSSLQGETTPYQVVVNSSQNAIQWNLKQNVQPIPEENTCQNVDYEMMATLFTPQFIRCGYILKLVWIVHVFIMTACRRAEYNFDCWVSYNGTHSSAHLVYSGKCSLSAWR